MVFCLPKVVYLSLVRENCLIRFVVMLLPVKDQAKRHTPTAAVSCDWFTKYRTRTTATKPTGPKLTANKLINSGGQRQK